MDDGDQFMATQMELLQSDAVLRPVAQRFHLLERESQLEKLFRTLLNARRMRRLF